jgi:hypothetical protein
MFTVPLHPARTPLSRDRPGIQIPTNLAVILHPSYKKDASLRVDDLDLIP